MHLTTNISHYDKVIFWKYIFGEGKNTLKGFENKAKHNIDKKYEIAYCRILKKKTFFEKCKTGKSKLGNLENLGNLGDIIPSFLISKFSILHKAKIENSDLKFSEKNFRVFWDFRVFQVLGLAHVCLKIRFSSFFDVK